MRIRRANISDATTIRDLYNELREYELSLLNGHVKDIQMKWETKKTLSVVKRWLSSKNDITLIVEGKRPAGFISFVIGPNNEASFDIYVKKEFRRKGFGKKLFNAALPYLKKRACKSVSLDVYPANRDAKMMYKNLGFELVFERHKRKI